MDDQITIERCRHAKRVIRAAGRICRGMKRGSKEMRPLARVGRQKRDCLWLKHNTEVDEEKELNKEEDGVVGGRANKILIRAKGRGLEKEEEDGGCAGQIDDQKRADFCPEKGSICFMKGAVYSGLMGWLENHLTRNPKEVSHILSECR